MKYPKWAPEGLTQLHAESVNRSRTPFDVDLLGRLIVKPEMHAAWLEIEKQHGCSDSTLSLSLLQHLMFLDINQILGDFRWAVVNRETREHRHERLTRIANAAKKFSEVVEGSVLDTPAYEYFPPKVLGQFIEQCRPEKAKGMFCLIEKHPDPDLPRDMIWDGDHPIQTLDGETEFWPIGTGYGSGLLALFEHLFPSRYPSISKLGVAIAKKAEKLAAEVEFETIILPSKPRPENAKRLYFIRRLGLSFDKWFGIRLKGTLSKFASAALNEPIGIESVNDAFRNWKPGKGGDV